jgi:UDP-N-acetyl-2-amino-2-deoxyglucuronate dehydrogenase
VKQVKGFTILQLRLHPSIIELKKRSNPKKGKRYNIVLTYITPWKWYHYSWKGMLKIGRHCNQYRSTFFDILTWIFGKAKSNILHHYQPNKAGGNLELENADVKWFLSLDKNDLPPVIMLSFYYRGWEGI